MASQNNLTFPFYSPPPPYNPFHPSPPPPAVKPSSPPPPHKPSAPPPRPPVQPPPLPPQPPSPDNHPTIVVIVFVSIGGVFFVAFLAAALFCFLKKRKKKSVQETELVHVDEHKKIQEVIVEGPLGTQSVVVSIGDDIHVDEKIKKNEKIEESLNVKSVEGKAPS